jgi:hypothetical protein
MRSVALAFALALCGASGGGCAIYTLDMAPARAPEDKTSVAPDLASRGYTKIMALPPSGTNRGELDAVISIFERELLKQNITVISSAVTGRVVMDSGGTAKKDEAAQGLSDAERALVMAKGTGADAILQIGALQWEQAVGRWFVLRGKKYEEVTQEEHSACRGARTSFPGLELVFVGRLIDVESGQVMASFGIRDNVTWTLPSAYRAELSMKEGKLVVKREDWAISAPDWIPAAKQRVLERTISLVAARITGKVTSQ